MIDFDAVFNRPLAPTATIEIDASVNRTFFELLAGNAADRESTLQYEVADLVPVRKHKKRRIQKKWLKRYGVKEVRKTTKIKGVPICEKKKGGLCEFVFRGCVVNG